MANETIVLYLVFIVAGILCGMMINIALNRKFYELGGITGGALVGLLMAIL